MPAPQPISRIAALRITTPLLLTRHIFHLFCIKKEELAIRSDLAKNHECGLSSVSENRIACLLLLIKEDGPKYKARQA